MVKPRGDFRARMPTERVKPDICRSKHFLATRPTFARKVDVAREKKPSGERGNDELRSRILGLLAGKALDKVEISKSLGLPVQRRAKLRELLRDMEIGGDIARIRKDRYVLPEGRGSGNGDYPVPRKRRGPCSR